MKLSLIILFCICCHICLGQNNRQIRTIDSAFYATQIDSLRYLFGYNKKIQIDYELSILIALSYFPELDSSKIIFKKARSKTTANARPTTLSLLFRKRTKRVYVIRINYKQKDSIVTLHEVFFNARIGLFGHELSHFIDYRGKNIFGITKRLLSYTNKKGKERFEKEIDLMTVNRGLGWQLYDFAFYVLNESDAKTRYKEFKKNIYLEPEEISEIINKSWR